MTTHGNDLVTYDALLPVEPDDGDKGPERVRIQQMLGFKRESDDLFDEYAMRAVATLDGAMGGVNHLDEYLNQFFVGFAVRDEAGNIVPGPEKKRSFGGCENGYCAYLTAERRLPLPLNDVFEFARFSSNPVTEVGEDKPGVRAYLGAPLLTPANLFHVGHTVITPGGELVEIPAQFVFGTLWVVDTKPRTGSRKWTKDHVRWINGQAGQLRDQIVDRAVSDGLVVWRESAS